MENLVAAELARWDDEVMNSSHSDLGTAHSRIMSSSSLRSSPGMPHVSLNAPIHNVIIDIINAAHDNNIQCIINVYPRIK